MRFPFRIPFRLPLVLELEVACATTTMMVAPSAVPRGASPFSAFHIPKHRLIATSMAFLVLSQRATAFTHHTSRAGAEQRIGVALFLSSSGNNSTTTTTTELPPPPLSSPPAPWNDPLLPDRIAEKRRNNRLRFRQHVNPLSSRFQQPAVLPPDWPSCALEDCRHRPLHLDIGCGKGGFLIDLCQKELGTSTESNFNYLGLEIRPGVAALAQERVGSHPGRQGRLEFVGCNANVDLARLLTLYAKAAEGAHPLQRVTVQFPDPHFKKRLAKRRVVTAPLVDTLARFMPAEGQIILQSDVQRKSKFPFL